MSNTQKYIIIAGFLRGRIDEATGAGLVQCHRGDVVELDADEAAVELHRNRIVAYDEETAASILASVQEPS